MIRLTQLSQHIMTQTKYNDEDISAIKALIQAFFDRVNDNDPQGLQTLFVPNADLTIIRQDPPAPPPSISMWSCLPTPPPMAPRKEEADEKLTVVLRITIEKFVKMVEDGNKKKKKDGKPPVPNVHEVPDLDRTDIKVDHLFAYAWSPFRVTFDGKLHHYGNFVYTLGKVKDEDGEMVWKFEGLTQNYRRTPGWEESASEFI